MNEDEFDPTSIGAVAVADEDDFDPTSIGAVPVEDDFDPTTIGAELVEEPQSIASQAVQGLQDIGRGFVRGVGGVISAAGGAASMVPESIGIGDVTPKPIKDIYRAAGDLITGAGKALSAVPGAPKTGTFEPGNPTWWAEKLPEVAPQLAAQIGLAYATKGRSVATFAATGGAQMAGAAYNEAKQERLEKGEDEETASKGAATEATIVGTLGAALEAIPGAEYLTKGPIGNLVGKIVRSKVAGKAAVGGAVESLTEMAQELTSIGAASLTRGKEFTAEEIKQRLGAAGALGLGAGTAVGAITSQSSEATIEKAVDADLAQILTAPPEQVAETTQLPPETALEPAPAPTEPATAAPSTPETAAPPALAEGTSSQRSEEPLPSVAEHLRTSPPVQSILAEQPAVNEPAMKEPSAPTEGGAIFSGGAKRPTVVAIGATPRGDKNWLKIPAWFKRAGKGLFTEGARGVLGRTNNQVGKELAKATRRHVDIEQELYGQHDKILRDAIRHVPPKRVDAAMAEVEKYNRDVENGRTPAPLAPDAKKILDAWYEVGKSTGDIARANNVQVFDAKLGAHRPMGTVKNYIPRMFSAEVENALRDPEGNAPMFNSLAQAIATHKGITIDAAAAELNTVAGRFTANDFHGNLELARNEQLPEIFYEYKLENLAARYLPAYSERMAQIIAYGQRLGPREAPLRKNLWDVARQESRDTETQQWLNEAEDQATGFKPKSVGGKLARRAQALGNAALLSDPTTTVVRNLLSGLSVTTERFGIARAVRELMAAGKAANQMDAKELGAVRDDIGNFLNAEQLGDSKLDEFVREFQRHALEKSGFSGSETYVRTHNALVASTFVRDAAASLATNPKSRLSKEALAQFKRWDVDAEKIVAEKGDWKTGPETRKFIRTAVRESQGGYRFDQVPLWGGTTAGRFVYQYGRWGMQRAKDIFENTIAPAIGEKVEFRGQKMTNRNVLPLMRLGLFTVGLGEVFAAISSVLFDRDRRDSTFSEIGEAWKEDELKAAKMLGERIVNDVIMAGTLGLIGQPVDFIKSMKDQSRLKNPTDPPSLFGVKALTTLAQRAQDQGGTLTKRDWLELAGQMARGPTNISKVARNVADDPGYQARNDVSTLRAAAQRWAKDTGLDVALRKSRGDFGKSPNAPFFEPIEDALLVGDSAKAKQLAADFIANQPDKKKASTALKTSVKGRQPFRAGTLTSAENLGRFMTWAEKNLPKSDLEQVKRVQKTYETAAKDAQLW